VVVGVGDSRLTSKVGWLGLRDSSTSVRSARWTHIMTFSSIFATWWRRDGEDDL